ncbi:hypothetical protein QZH41_004357 [Actinostola sp. cb2023]|nr:hypothetical protein QZH41_004357 [Actinostola sp. cb2023]
MRSLCSQWDLLELKEVVLFRSWHMALDILGPLPKSDLSNRFLLVVGDYTFTKWTEAYPIPNQEAIAVTGKLVDKFICRFGAPEILHTDQGRKFESKFFKERCRLLGIEKTRMSAYHPEGDGMIDRFNCTVIGMLSVHESTRYSPFYMMFGRNTQLPIDIMYGRAPEEPQETVEYTRHLRDSLEAAHDMARTHLQAAQRRQKDYYDRRVTSNPFKVGDRVLCQSLLSSQ